MSARLSNGETPARHDKHLLYQASVQDPEFEIRFMTRAFRAVKGRVPLSLREDFCGTALLCSEWVKSRADRVATGVDLDPKVLRWGREHNIEPLGDAARRVSLCEGEVRKTCTKRRFDAVVALNYSYFVFRTRDDLRAYFANVRAALTPEGLFFIDLYGGPETQEVRTETRRVNGFVYVWDQAAFNPIDNSAVNHIHFRFRDGKRMQRAFTYRWRLWQLVELRELLAEAGFAKTEVYWEDEDEEGNAAGTFRRRIRVENDPCWNAYIVSSGVSD